MRARIGNFVRRPFVRNVAAVATGTAASQAISMAFSPLITRLYGPENLGLQSIFISVIGLVNVIAALGYPIAIVLPKNDTDARGLIRLSIYTTFGTALLVTVLLYIFGADLLKLINAQAIADFVYLIPIAMVISVLGNVLGQWLIRKQAFGFSAKYGVVTTLLLNLLKTGLGFFQPTAMALIVTNTFGGIISTTLIWLGWRKHASKLNNESIDITTTSTLTLAKKHKDFPLLRTPQNLINAFSQSLPILLLATFFGVHASGQYGIAIAVLAMPASLIGGSVMSVFYPRINRAIHDKENVRSLIIKATAGMAMTGALPFAIIIFTGPVLFQFIFGEKWQTAGVYAQWLSPWLFLQYINKPAVSAVPALHLQGELLAYELASTATKIVGLWIGFAVFKSDVAAIALFSVFGVIAYIWLILWIINQSGKITENE